jgi:formamidopyrimidine-DNA glycosylase
MPELPDLQVFSKNLNKDLAGRKLKTIEVTKGAKVNVSTQVLKQKFENQKLKTVFREGKELRMLFSNKNIIGLHMMLHGKLVWFEEEPPKHTLVQFRFDKDKNLALTDFQRNARVNVNPEPSEAPDALTKDVNIKFLKNALQTKATIKNVLLDQHVIRGIGNAYADEILWEARISPFSVSRNIPADRIRTLLKAIKSVLKKAEKQINKAAPGIIGGEIRDFLVVHNAKKKTTPSGGRIINKTVGGRKTYYTAEQKQY